ncbi:phage tail family protein [Arthrobacter koreensis]|uniref:Phage tail family protein n=1 Tax=Arthrobacter koreensis TaxID=199136 RepID=A0ABY6FQM9_9MICC|nr:phage tail family protein [Arthrobacter koreensis]UYB35508.1 phage tail family protein [Arthrobacter koreensis]
MVNIVYAAPYAAPVPDNIRRWGGITHRWTGWDGSTWDLSDVEGGVFLLNEGLEGLGMPDITNYTHDSPVVHGVSWDGWLATGRKVFWSVAVFHDTDSEGWIARHRAFWKTLRPGKAGVWSVELPTGEKFSLTLRFKSDGGHSYTNDPVHRGWEVYGIELFPEQPFWEAPAVVESWGAEEKVPFLGPDGAAPPFFPSPAATLSTAKVTNPGDVETFIQWTITGPTETVTVGIGSARTVVPFPVPDGSKLVIDTNPRNLIAELDGVDVMERLSEFNYSPLPPGEGIALSLSRSGPGAVEARFTPLMLMGV